MSTPAPLRPVFAPAKLNLFLAVTGPRADGFHDLVSLVCPVAVGDTLEAERLGPGAPDTLECDDPSLPAGPDNLVLRAAAAHREAAARLGLAPAPGLAFRLWKRLPHGAGLGGGSSDAAAALRLLDAAAPAPLPTAELCAAAARVGSDVPLFLAGGAAVMRGRGELLEPLPAAARERLRGQRVLLVHPGFGVETPWAYRRLAEGAPASYLPAAVAEARLLAWLSDPAAPLAALLFNSFAVPVAEKFVALRLLADALGAAGLPCLLTGSGSAVLALLPPGFDAAPLRAVLAEDLGPTAWFAETTLAP